MLELLVGLLNIPSPTGYTHEAVDYVRQHLQRLPLAGLSWSVTKKGALLARWPGVASSAPRGVTAHLDTLGLMVKEIKGNGRLKTTQLGGYMWNAVESEGVTVRTAADLRYRGSLQPANPSTHVNRDLAKRERNAELMEIRLDARTTSEAATRALGIEVGDFVFLDPRVEVSSTGFVRSRHLDDKAGVAAIFGALGALHTAQQRPAQDTYILFSNYEEVGHGGAADFPAELDELLVVDMGALGEGQNSDEFSVSICAKDSSGPYHFDMVNKLRALAVAHQIAYKMDIYPYYGSDGSAYWQAGGSARVGLLGPGVEASHAYERTHTDGLVNTAHLIACYLLAK
ncbi:MAG: M42 family metallopeptidase [Anaerolineae bacterium]|nr:M42 family metallopeptidase [Anaerolineae bacterium]